MQLTYDAVDKMYEELLFNGMAYMVEVGIESGYLSDRNEGVLYFREMITMYEHIEEYERCQALLDMVTDYMRSWHPKQLGG